MVMGGGEWKETSNSQILPQRPEQKFPFLVLIFAGGSGGGVEGLELWKAEPQRPSQSFPRK